MHSRTFAFVIVFPNCKINLGLRVLAKRGDGYHHIETVFYPIPLKDVVELLQQETTRPESENQLNLTEIKEKNVAYQSATASMYVYGLPVAGNPAENLCVKAWNLIKHDFPDLPPVQIHLLKNIPMGAGLGGGSADGAFMLQLINEKFQLSIPKEQLLVYALQLGSDCPFFLFNKPCFAHGRGELMEPLELDLSAYQLAFQHPGIHINTGWAFSQINLNDSKPTATLQEIISSPVEDWKQQLENDFEKPVFEKYPAIAAIKAELHHYGALYASMSGSGSTVFGLFKKTVNTTSLLPPAYSVIDL